MYAQNLNGTWRELAGNIKFSETIYQTAESLSDEQRQTLSVYFITDAARPQLTFTQKFGDPVFTIQGANVERSYPVIDKTVEEIQQDTDNRASEVRTQRNEKLRDSDWTQVADTPVDKTVWATYRQALRNVPSQEGFPWTITWPTQP
jgi:hypothetical protein